MYEHKVTNIESLHGSHQPMDPAVRRVAAEQPLDMVLKPWCGNQGGGESQGLEEHSRQHALLNG